MRLAVLIVGLVLVAACGATGAPAPVPDGMDIAIARDLGGTIDALSREVTAPDGGSLGDAPTPVDARTEVAAPPCAADACPGDAAPERCSDDAACDDRDPCTRDRCVDGVCTRAPQPPGVCCAADADCDDGVACTLDTCSRLGECLNERGSNRCCLTRADCDDGDPCTDDLCLDHLCVSALVASETCRCGSNLGCVDGLACTKDVCEDGACTGERASGLVGCCDVDTDCDDADPQSVDTCLRHTCLHEVSRACVDDARCDDADPCTQDRCEGGHCRRAPIPGCCRVDGQCADSLALTFDRCIGAVCVHALTDPPPACDGAPACDDGEPCTVETCIGGACSVALAEAAGCCAEDATCDDADPCTDDACTGLRCTHAPVAGPVPWRTWRFGEAELATLTVEDDGSGARWQLSGRQYISGPTSLYFGRLAPEPTIDTGTRVQGVVRTAEVLLGPAPVALRFLTFVDVEPLFSRDLFDIAVESAGGETVVWSKEDLGGSTQHRWDEVVVDLSAWAGAAVRLRLRFDSVDEIDNEYEGIYVDDLELRWPCGSGR